MHELCSSYEPSKYYELLLNYKVWIKQITVVNEADEIPPGAKILLGDEGVVHNSEIDLRGSRTAMIKVHDVFPSDRNEISIRINELLSLSRNTKYVPYLVRAASRSMFVSSLIKLNIVPIVTTETGHPRVNVFDTPDEALNFVVMCLDNPELTATVVQLRIDHSSS